MFDREKFLFTTHIRGLVVNDGKIRYSYLDICEKWGLHEVAILS